MHADDDDEDLSTLDRGDNLPDEVATEKPAAEKPADEKPAKGVRDGKGRFAKEEENEGEEAEPEGEEAEPEGEEGEEEPEAGAPEDDKNYALRLKKMKDQRDAARVEAQREREQRAAIEAQRVAATKEKEGPSPLEQLNAKLEGLYEKVEEARADVDLKEAARLQREIDGINREITRLESTKVSREESFRLQENTRFNAMVDTVEEMFDVLNPAHEDYDERLVKEMDFQTDAYEKAGLTPTQALRRAITLVFRVDPWSKKPPAKAEAPEEKPAPKAKGVDVKKAIDDAKKQPPDLSTRGANRDSTKINVMDLSDEDFDKLPESKKKELRGDNYA